MTAIEYLNSKMVSFFDKNIINIFRVPLCVSVLKKKSWELIVRIVLSKLKEIAFNKLKENYF